MDPFFPNIVFAWLFVLVLCSILVVASWFDFRTVIVPKKVSITLLVTGVVFTLIRCAWLGGEGQRAWLFFPSNLGLGVADGLLFALSGFAVGFLLFFVMWLVNIAGGGDVKVAAALAAWLGPKFIFGVLLFSVPIVLLIVVGTYLGTFLGYDLNPASLPQDANTPKHVKRPTRRKMTFSLPLTLATILLLFLGFRNELGLVETPAVPQVSTEPSSK